MNAADFTATHDFAKNQYEVLSPEGVAYLRGQLDAQEAITDLLATLSTRQMSSAGVQAVIHHLSVVTEMMREQLMHQDSTPQVSDELNLFS